jgi:hypothetical protein
MAELCLVWQEDDQFSQTTTNLVPLNFMIIVLHHSSTIIGPLLPSRVNDFLNIFRRLRVPYYGAILEFLNFAMLLLTFVLCLSRKLRHVSFVIC